MNGNQGTVDFSPLWQTSLFPGNSCSCKEFARGLASEARVYFSGMLGKRLQPAFVWQHLDSRHMGRFSESATNSCVHNSYWLD